MVGTMAASLQPLLQVCLSGETQISYSLSSCSLRREQRRSHKTAPRKGSPERCASPHEYRRQRVFLRTMAFQNDFNVRGVGQVEVLFRISNYADFQFSSRQKNVVHTSGLLLSKHPSGLVAHFPLSPILHGCRSSVCRARSIEGTEKSSSAALDVDRRKVELSSEGNSHGEGKVTGEGRSSEDAQIVDFESDENSSDVPEDQLRDNSQNGGVTDISTDKLNEQSRDENLKDEEFRREGFRNNGSRHEGGKFVEAEDSLETERQGSDDEDDWDPELQYVSRIPVPRQKYIKIAKVDLVNALLLFFFPSTRDHSKFLSICSYLELILHSEHKLQLEELRSDYSVIQTMQDGRLVDSSKRFRIKGATNASKLGSPTLERAEKHRFFGDATDWPANSPESEGDPGKVPALEAVEQLRDRVVDAFKKPQRKIDLEDDTVEDHYEGPSNYAEASEAAEERFQKNTLALLARAQFEGISVRDLELTNALNPDYLLTLPVDVDWKRTSSANVKIFRRGYTKEETNGFLLGAKLDYLQAGILRRLFKGFTGPLLRLGRWFLLKWRSLWENDKGREVAKLVSGWLQEPLQLQREEEPLNALGQPNEDDILLGEKDVQLDMPIWLAARQAIPRYEAVLSSAGSRGMVIRRILVRMGLLQPESPATTVPSFGDEDQLEPHLRPIQLSRVSMKDIWRPTSKAAVGGNITEIISSAFSVFFSQSGLLEPAYKELVLLYNGSDEEDAELDGLQLQTYKNIPLPDLKIVFPSKKLIYRALDTLRLDITSVAGLLAFVVNNRFDNTLNSPSSFLLDLIAASALVVFVTRVAFGYKNVWDRYQLLINKTLFEKTVSRGFGVIQFLLDESEEQQFKEAILVFLLLMNEGKDQGMTKAQLANSCEKFLYYRCKEQVEMPVDSAVETLLRLGLIMENRETASPSQDDTDVYYKTLSFDKGLEALEHQWVSQPRKMSLWN